MQTHFARLRAALENLEIDGADPEVFEATEALDAIEADYVAREVPTDPTDGVVLRPLVELEDARAYLEIGDAEFAGRTCRYRVAADAERVVAGAFRADGGGFVDLARWPVAYRSGMESPRDLVDRARLALVLSVVFR